MCVLRHAELLLCMLCEKSGRRKLLKIRDVIISEDLRNLREDVSR